MKKAKAAGFISGGLDSILAVELMKKQNLDIILVHVINGFEAGTMRARADIDITESQFKGERKDYIERQFALPVEVVDISNEFLSTLAEPRYGYGKNMNPCIDCKIDFFSIGRDMIEEGKADFIFTGEVLGQRPMSQNRKMMQLIEKRSNLERLIIRPLSGKVMKQTIPEEKGWVDREKLLDIQGRSRRRQMALAEELGVAEYPSPAGGCLLTDINFARRLKDLIDFKGGDITVQDTVTLSVGRHFRVADRARVVAGRNEKENNYLAGRYPQNWLFEAADVSGPTVALFGNDSDQNMISAASITARYCNDRESSTINVIAERGDEKRLFEAAPAGRETLSEWMV